MVINLFLAPNSQDLADLVMAERSEALLQKLNYELNMKTQCDY